MVEASPRGECSISRNLAARFVADWKTAHPEGEVVERDLAKMNLPYVNLPWLGASLTPIEAHTLEMKEVLTVSNELVDELLAAADYIASSTPVYNYNIPANLNPTLTISSAKAARSVAPAKVWCTVRSALSYWLRAAYTRKVRRSAIAISRPCTCGSSSRSSESMMWRLLRLAAAKSLIWVSNHVRSFLLPLKLSSPQQLTRNPHH
jgi:Flavodoxin-like fold